MRKILILAENDGGAGEREGRGGDGDSNEVIGAGGGVLLVIGLGGVLGRADNDDGGGPSSLTGVMVPLASAVTLEPAETVAGSIGGIEALPDLTVIT